MPCDRIAGQGVLVGALFGVVAVDALTGVSAEVAVKVLRSRCPVVTMSLTLTPCVLALNIVDDALRDRIDPDSRDA